MGLGVAVTGRVQLDQRLPNVHGITLWGDIVGATWVANTGLQQTSGTMRPAMAWLMSFLGR